MEIKMNNVPNRGSYRPYDHEKLANAYMAVKEKTMSLRKASQVFGVPKSTLQDRLIGKVDFEVLKSGTQPLFSQEHEALLAGHLKTMAEVGYGYSRQETINLATDYAITLGLRDKNHPLTDRWLYKFLARWPELGVKKPHSLEVSRAKSATRLAIDNYFDELQHILVKYNLTDKPHMIYNIDEKGLSTEHKPPKVICGKFSKTQAVTSGKGKTVTLIGCVNGIGQQVPPYLIFPGARMSDSLMAGGTPGAVGRVSESGWSNTEIFADYMQQHLLKYLPPRHNEHVLVLYDGHKSHVSLTLIEWAKSENIILFVLPPHCSHLLQPLDVSCFGPFELAWNNACHTFIRESGGCLVTRYDVCQLACKVYASTLSPANIQAAFRKCGIYPFNRNVIDNQVAPATAFCKTPDTTALLDNTAVQAQSQNAESFLLNKGGKILENVKKAKVRNTLSKVVGGKAITEDDIVNKIIEHKANATKPKQNQGKQKVAKKSMMNEDQTPSTSGVPAKKQRKSLNESSSSDYNDDSDDEANIPESDKCVVCKKYYVDTSKEPGIIITKWGQCDQCKLWVHLRFCTKVRVLRRGDTFLCPNCADPTH